MIPVIFYKVKFNHIILNHELYPAQTIPIDKRYCRGRKIKKQ